MNARPTIVWFRQCLRLQDNPALAAAIARGGPVLPIYIWSPEEEGAWPPGGASKWWLHHSLQSLDRSLKERGSCLVVRRGGSVTTLREMIQATGANAVYCNRRFEPASRQCDRDVEKRLAEDGVEFRSYNSSLLLEPETIRNASGQPFQVFTPFWKACLAAMTSIEVLPAPIAIPCVKIKDVGRVADLNLLPPIDWAAGLRAAWNPGESGALAQLQRFVESGVSDYAAKRDRPDEDGVSRLSPHIHFGEISPRQVWRAALQARAGSADPGPVASAASYVRQLGWREFAHHLLYHFPQTPDAPLRPEFNRFPWHSNNADMKAWQRGRTGYPLVDAGMRELWATGWMHNRVRMVVASFLTKDLLISWQAGARWFWDTLVDADLANNTLGWQWTAGCGADAAPYFRVFNPVLQGEKFDPEGEYVRRWVPELSGLPTQWIHHPWLAPGNVLQSAGVVLGETYPHGIVDHAFARERALAAFGSLR